MPHWPKPIGFNRTPKDNKDTIKALKYLGNPQNKLNNIIHIAGTNGKGSTLAFIKQILIENKYKVNCFTSPFLLNFNEQICIKNNIITDREIIQYFEEVRIKLEDKFNLTFFQTVTIATLYIFSKNNADFNLIETGLGGRIDATNVFKKKYLSILSPISYDHMEYLGDTLIKITCEKSDIIMNSDHVVIAKQKPIVNACLKIILTNNNIANASFFKRDYDFDFVDNKFYYIDINNETISNFNQPKLAGCHQLINLSTAITAAQKIASNFHLTYENTNRAIINTNWPGRLEEITIPKKYITNSHNKIIFDGAHNDNGAKFLAKWLKENPFNGETILIYGRTKGKDHNLFLQKFRNIIKEINIVEVQHEPSSASIKEIKESINLSLFKFSFHNEVFSAIKQIQQRTGPFRIVCCGSLFLYRDLKLLF
ncbi:MAG: hypothetical protein ISQ32_03410 [Rickettsiales bacterium]|nr:hypothetical protein [Rickettsiales bacterium]